MTPGLIILDRDGVINYDSDQYIKSAEEWIAIESSLTAIALLCKAGYAVAVATNQSGLSRGFFSRSTLSEIHKKMLATVKLHGGQINAIQICADHPDNPGPDRKPAPGMALKLLKSFDAIAEETWFIGDSLSDISCALNSGCKPALVLTGKGQNAYHSPLFNAKTPVFKDLLAFTNHLLS